MKTPKRKKRKAPPKRKRKATKPRPAAAPVRTPLSMFRSPPSVFVDDGPSMADEDEARLIDALNDPGLDPF